MKDHITIEGHDGAFAAYIARPKTSPAPAVVVLQESLAEAAACLPDDGLSGSKSQQNRSRDYFRLADDPTNMLCSNGEIRLSRSMLETNGQPTKAPAPD